MKVKVEHVVKTLSSPVHLSSDECVGLLASNQRNMLANHPEVA